MKEEVGSRSLWPEAKELRKPPLEQEPLPHSSGPRAERGQSQEANECTLSTTNWHLPLPSTSTRIKSCVAVAAEFQQQPERRSVSQVALVVKNLPIQKTWVRSLVWEDPLEEGMVTHSSILAWRIPWTEDPDGLQSVGLQRVRYD